MGEKVKIAPKLSKPEFGWEMPAATASSTKVDKKAKMAKDRMALKLWNKILPTTPKKVVYLSEESKNKGEHTIGDTATIGIKPDVDETTMRHEVLHNLWEQLPWYDEELSPYLDTLAGMLNYAVPTGFYDIKTRKITPKKIGGVQRNAIHWMGKAYPYDYLDEPTEEFAYYNMDTPLSYENMEEGQIRPTIDSLAALPFPQSFLSSNAQGVKSLDSALQTDNYLDTYNKYQKELKKNLDEYIKRAIAIGMQRDRGLEGADWHRRYVIGMMRANSDILLRELLGKLFPGSYLEGKDGK